MEKKDGRFLKALKRERPLQIIGVPNALSARMAEKAGYKAIYLSGSLISGLLHALPDLGILDFKEFLFQAEKITDSTDLPLLLDIDTGFGAPLFIERVAKKLTQAKVAAVHIEDQIAEKKCGHLEGKRVISIKEMGQKIKALKEGSASSDFFIVARTDALNIEPFESVIERCRHYLESGADMIFLEAARDLKTYSDFKKACPAFLLANLTEFGKTPLFKKEDLAKSGVDAILYPLTLMRLMNKTVEKSLKWLKENESQESLVDQMQTRKEFYELIDYEDYEKRSYLK